MSSNIYSYIIDQECKHKSSKIYVQDGCVYSCTLNQTDVKSNKNKFYIMQILDKGNGSYCHFTRYGRIGESGKTIYKELSDLSNAIASYEKQFKTKTGNKWENREDFVFKKGKYFLTEISYEGDIKKDDLEKLDKQIEIKNSILDERTQELMKLISDVNMMKNALLELDIDPKKMPLGKISASQIDKASTLLNEATDIVKELEKLKDSNKTQYSILLEQVYDITSQFYTLIPYSCGRNVPPVIDNMERIGKYVSMLDDLRNIEVGTKILENSDNDLNPLDSVYNGLNADIKPLDKDGQLYKEIEKYVHNTHASTHSYYTSELLDVYEVQRSGERDIYEKYIADNGIDNKYLLFHGSRMANIMGITKLGLLLNPQQVNPNVVITGKMFGYGIYLANSFSKSFNYCGSSKENPIACLFLCEAALGKPAKKQYADYYVNKNSLEQEGCHSTWGQGSNGPDMKKTCEIDGVKIPNGKLKKTGIHASLQYDEFIVYDQRQLNIKYILLVKANYK